MGGGPFDSLQISVSRHNLEVSGVFRDGLVLNSEESAELLVKLKVRFDGNRHRHRGMEWERVCALLLTQLHKLWSLNAMEATGGDPDVVVFDPDSTDIFFVDCSKESPAGRRSLCYDQAALNARKENKPKHSAMGMAMEMGIEVLDEDLYASLQAIETLDTKTSSWLKTPADVREKGGAIFGDWRFGRTFIYHNRANSYYGSRGFRGLLRV